jgi:hypothetical protein
MPQPTFLSDPGRQPDKNVSRETFLSGWRAGSDIPRLKCLGDRLHARQCRAVAVQRRLIYKDIQNEMVCRLARQFPFACEA